MLETLYFLTTLVLVFENALDFRSLKHYKKPCNRRKCLHRLVRRHAFMAVFFTWGAWLYGIASTSFLLWLLAGCLTVAFGLEIAFDKAFLKPLKRGVSTLFFIGLLVLSVHVFYQIMGPWLLVGLVVIAFPLFVLLFDCFHGWFLRRFARVVPYFHRMDDADYLLGLDFSEQAYMIDAKALGNLKNAMIVGFFHSKHLYLSKSMLASMPHAMIEGIVAHEVGHIRRSHIVKRLLFAYAIVLTFAMYGIWVFNGASDAFTLYTALFAGWFLLGTLARALLALMLQHQEYEADQYAKDIGKAVNLSSALVRLKRQEDEQGDPLRALLHATHPQVEKRIERLTQHGSK